MVLFLYGTDDYRREARARSYAAQFTTKHGPDGLAEFDLESGDTVEQVNSFFRTPSLFNDRKLSVVRGLLTLTPGVLKKFLAAHDFSKGFHLLAVERVASVPKPYSFLLQVPVKAEAFAPLDGAAWAAYVAKLAAEKGAPLSPKARGLLAAHYEGNTWGLATELEKLSGLGKAEVGEQELAHLHYELTPDFWALTQRLRAPRREDRLQALQQARLAGEPAAKLFSILAAVWKENAARAAACDVSIKTGKLDYEEALLALVIS